MAPLNGLNNDKSRQHWQKAGQITGIGEVKARGFSSQWKRLLRCRDDF